MKKCCFIWIFYLSFFSIVHGQKNVIGILDSKPSTRDVARIDHLVYLNNAMTGSRNSNLNVSLPIYGKQVQFVATANNVADAESLRQFPNILTYDIISTDNPIIKGSLTLTPVGVFATVIGYPKMVSIYPDDLVNVSNHIIEYGNQPDLPKPKQMCGHIHDQEETRSDRTIKFGSRMGLAIGGRRYPYRLAIVCTGEYYRKNGNTDLSVRSSIIGSVNAVAAIFKNELNFDISVGSRIRLYNDPASDPFIPDMSGGQGRTVQAANIVGTSFAQGAYDIGHVFHTHADGDGWSNGGLAGLGVVCSNSASGTGFRKGTGWSGAFSNRGNGWISLATHEFAHQYNATHTFNGTGESCTDNISDISAVEIGSGTTIMSYNGICDVTQNISSSNEMDNYFHATSLFRMYDYVANGPGGSCAVNANNTTNEIPVVTANPCNAVYKIPKNTPFYLNAKTIQTDSDILTYCWEQTDEDGPGTPTQGRIGLSAGANARAPLFRSYPPSLVSERYFPNLAILTAGGLNSFDVLPNVARQINMNIAVRDNNTVGGGVGNDNITITVENNGPFEVSRPRGGELFTGGMMEAITWSTNGSDALCNNVRIKLSLDGGKTYGLILAENIAYAAGTFNFAVPSNIVATSQARIMVECMDFDCFKIFNISKDNFTLSSSCRTPLNYTCPLTPLTADQGDAALNLGMSKINGNEINALTRRITTTSPAMNTTVFASANGGCTSLTQVRYETSRFQVDKTGGYSFSVNTGFQDGFGFVSIFRAANFNPNSPCGSFVASSGTWTGTSNSVRAISSVSANLTSCTEYILVFFNYEDLPKSTQITNMSGVGRIIEPNATPDPLYTIAFVAVNTTTGRIAGVSADSDFRSLSGGDFEVYSISLLASETLASLVGLSLSQAQLQKCVNVSPEPRLLKINSSCLITKIELGAQTPCVAATNAYTQKIIITYTEPPTTGKIVVNGQSFDITNSPQEVTLIGLDSDGQKLTVEVLFDDFLSCRRVEEDLIQAPVNCCPLNFDLGADISSCVGRNVELNAGAGGTSYKWFRNNVEIAGQSTSKLSVSSSGEYSVEVTHSSGCQKTDRIKVDFIALPTINLQPTLEFCEGETFEIISIVAGTTDIKWFRNNLLIPNQNTAKLFITEGGDYKVEARSGVDCIESKIIKVTQISKPIVNLGADIEKCESEDVVLNAGMDGTTFQWFRDGTLIPSAIDNTFKPLQSGEYRVVVRNNALCISESRVNVRFFASPEIADLPVLTNICSGDTYTIKATVSGAEQYQWFYNGNIIPGSITTEFIPNNSGTYAIEASNNIGCKTRKSTQIEIRTLPNVNIDPTIVSCIGSQVELSGGTDGKTYKWERNGSTIANITNKLAVTQDGTYKVTVTNEYDCFTIASSVVTFVPGPSLELGGDVTICQDSIHLIRGTTSANNSSIRWFKDDISIPNQSALTLSVSTAGNYEMRLTGGTPACEVRKSVKVTVNPKPGVNLMNDRNLCEGETIPVLDGGANQTSYVWTFNGAALANTRTVNADKSGRYRVAVTNSFNCKNSDDVVVTINNLPTLTADTLYNLCEGTPLILNLVSDGTKFEWKRNNIVIIDATTKSYSIKDAGNYTVTASNAASCNKAVSFRVVVKSKPVFDLGVNTTLCPDETRTLNAGAFTSYIWSDGTTNRTLAINAGKPNAQTINNYKVTVTDTNNCQSVDSVTITLLPIVKVEITSDKPGVCNGEPVRLTATGGTSYIWTGPAGTLDMTTGNSVTASPTSTSTYTVEASNACPNNKDSKSIELKVFEPVDISAGNDTCAILGRSIKLNARGGSAYDWDNKNLIVGAANVANPEIKIEVETVFTVLITDKNGCKFTDSVTICIIEDPLSLFKAVNYLTPNDDGQNDDLYFAGLEAFPDNTLKVFNRWGNMIFESKGYQTRGTLFNGIRNGERLPADTYYYVLTFSDQVIKSSLTILWD